MTIKLGVLVSGNGTNLQAILDAIGSGALSARVELVVSDNPKAFALSRAEKHKIPAKILNRKDFPSKEAFEQALIEALQEKGIEWVVLAGFMRLLSPHFLKAYPHRILNIHPALLPSFPGLEAVKQAFDSGVKITGCTVHFIDEGCDTGPTIAQRTVAVLSEDTLDSLTEKVHREEHKLYPEVLQWIAEGRVELKGRKVIIK